MAQPIRCDRPEHDHLADVMVSRLDGSVTVALCDEAFLEFALGLVAAAMPAQDAPQAPEGEGGASSATPRRRGRSQPVSVPAPAVQVEEVEGDEPEPEPARDWEGDYQAAQEATLAALDQPEREPVEA